MPFFRYSATDKTGVQSMGTVEAATAEDGMQQLLSQGFTVNQIMKAPDQAQPPARAAKPPSALSSAPIVQRPTPSASPPRAQPKRPDEQLKTSAPASPARVPTAPARLPTAPQTPVTNTSKQINRTKPAKDRDRMLLFSQLSKQLKAGIGPAEAFDNLRQRVPKHMTQSMEDAARAATNGEAISDSFERYPDLYPETTVGMLRAAEQGGFLEEATELLSDQAQSAHSFARSYWWVGPMLINAVIALPLAVIFMRGVVRSWSVFDSQGEGASSNLGSSIGVIWTSVLKETIWPGGPITLLLWAVFYFAFRFIRTPKMKMKRHALALGWPVFGPRTRHECLAVFSWVMSKLGHSGISPKSSWDLAAASVPNLAVKEKLENIGRALAGNEKLSDAIFRERLFTEDYAPLIATAEHTGDIPKAFEQLSKISKSEFESAETNARQKSRSWGCAGQLLISGILLILVFWYMYVVLMPGILNGIE